MMHSNEHVLMSQGACDSALVSVPISGPAACNIAHVASSRKGHKRRRLQLFLERNAIQISIITQKSMLIDNLCLQHLNVSALVERSRRFRVVRLVHELHHQRRA